jgi:hypothetical protein
MYLSVLNLMNPDGPVRETELFHLEVITSWSQLPSWHVPSPSEPCSTLLPPPLDFSLRQALLCHRSKTCSSALSSLDCSLVDRERVHPLVLLAHVGDQELLLLLLGKNDHLVWGSGPSSFPVSESCCPTSGRCVRNSHLLCSSLHSQNPQHVLTILGGRASAVEPMVCTTLPTVDKAGTSSVEVPTA